VTGPYVEANTSQRERLRALVERLTDEELCKPVGDRWSIADVLGHIAFWDARSLWLAEKIERSEPFTAAEVEPDDPTWINESVWPIIHAIAPRDAAQLALRLAEEVDRKVASLPPERTWPTDPNSLLNPMRAEHRREHLDQIEAAFRLVPRREAARP
jgi:hypothetical protein